MEKRKYGDIGAQPPSKNAKISHTEKKAVVERVFASAPVRYAPPAPPKKAEDRYETPVRTLVLGSTLTRFRM